jgi:hypothetical protein
MKERACPQHAIIHAVGIARLLVIAKVKAGVGDCTPQHAVDFTHTEIRIQLTILRKASNCDEKFIIYICRWQ